MQVELNIGKSKGKILFSLLDDLMMTFLLLWARLVRNSNSFVIKYDLSDRKLGLFCTQVINHTEYELLH